MLIFFINITFNLFFRLLYLTFDSFRRTLSENAFSVLIFCEYMIRIKVFVNNVGFRNGYDRYDMYDSEVKLVRHTTPPL